MRLVAYISAFLGGVVVCYLLWSLGVVDKIGGIPSHQKDPIQSVSIYLSFVGVLLTAVTAILTALAIGIGVIAAYTFKELKESARTTSEDTAKKVAELTAAKVTTEALSDVKIRAILLEFYAAAETERQQAAEWGQDPADNEER